MNYQYNESEQVDHKIVKRIYPRTNKRTSLEFILEKEPNLYPRMHTMKLFLRVTIPKGYAPDIALPAKLCSDIRIGLDFISQKFKGEQTNEGF